ncbi:MAG: serine/threonine protein kinase [Planctomyces sp.]
MNSSENHTQDSQQDRRNQADLSDLRIGEFLLLRRLGSGGMADVYLAEQTSLGRQVAVKVLKNDSLQGRSDVLLKRFEQEARAAGGLSHPNVVQIITTGHENNIAYIVQEYVPGLNLSQWIRRNGPPDFSTGVKWLQQMAAALSAAAEAGIVHRDIKPENILLNRQATAKVTDFGLAQLNQPAPARMNLTQAGTTLGTPWYMSPEQIQGTKLDHRSDQYSLGVTAWHMFAGRPPFPGRNPMTVAVQHLKELPPPLATLRPDLPLPLCTIIDRMLAKKPEDRFPDGPSLELALAAAAAMPPRELSAEPSDLVGRLRRCRPAITLAVGAMLACTLATWTFARLTASPIQLPAPSVYPEIRKQPSAARQYALAMLQPDRQDLWNAVSRFYPESTEAEMASLQLGVALMASAVPDAAGALKAFSAVREKGEVAPEKNYLQLLGMIGQAWTLRDRPRSPELEQLLSDIQQQIDNYQSDDLLQLDIDRAPIELQQYFGRLQMTRRQPL